MQMGNKTDSRMIVDLLQIDSEVFGRNVLVIINPDAKSDFAPFERAYVDAYQPIYVSCKVALEDVSVMHMLEDSGFRMVECQLKGVITFRQPWDTSAYPYRFERVTSEAVLEEVLQIAKTTFEHDRFSMDPACPLGVSGDRYLLYTRKSFTEPNESVYRLYDPKSKETLAFKTCRRADNNKVQLFLSGLRSDMKGLGLGPISNYFYFNELINQRIKAAYGYVSAHNYAAVNMDLSMGFRVRGAFAVLRKTYA